MLSSLSLLVPGLLAKPVFSAAMQGQDLPALDRLFAKVVESIPAAMQFDQQLIHLLGGPRNDQIKLGVTASLAYLLGKDHFAVTNAARYLMAYPVHLQADSGRLLMYGQDGLDIEADEVEQWLAELSTIFVAHNIAIHSVSAETWLLCLAHPPQATFSELSDVLGQDIHDYMPAGDKGMFWRSLINEVQMQLHQSPLNSKRQARGLKAINSLWFAGVGDAVTLNKTNWSSLYSDNAMVCALADQAGIKWRSVAAGDSVVDYNSDCQLIVDTSLVESAAREDLDHWYQALQTFHDTIVAPIVDAFNDGAIKTIQLYPINGHCYRIASKRGLAKFIDGLRKKQSFADYMAKKS
ncbi:MAG: hypothetical protein JKY90_03065 [Gammaproteobacteria bacterium]|nr:hypothetical protein [Gammaproteobacteria bacterium]